MRTPVEKLAAQRAKTDLARAKLEEALANRAARVVMKYDATDANMDRMRRKPPKEKKREDKVQSTSELSRAVSVGRDLRRNNGAWKVLEAQLCTVSVGTGPKLTFNSEEDSPWWLDASNWFNSVWAKECDGVDDNHLADLVWNVLAAIPREGDVLCAFDDFDRDDGTLRFFETDQVTSIAEMEWNTAATKRGWPWKEQAITGDRRMVVPMLQDRGVVRDLRGRVVAYIVDREHGRVEIPIGEATIIPSWHPRDPEHGSAKLIKMPWRFNQLRGVGDSLTIANQQRDIYEMISAELQSAKKAAQYFATISTDPAGAGAVERALANSSLTPDQIDSIMYGAGDGTDAVTAKNYDELEGVFGGRMEYLMPGDEFKLHSNDRPSDHIGTFADRIQAASGASMGIARSRALMQANGSYTAFRGEELMTWETARLWQKRIERRLMDFLVYKAVTWAVNRNLLDKPPRVDWHTKAAWKWPEMREVDEVRSANAERIYLKNGHYNLADVLGPDWRKKFEIAGKVLEAARELGLPLSMFESISGAELTSEQEPEQDTQSQETSRK